MRRWGIGRATAMVVVLTAVTVACSDGDSTADGASTTVATEVTTTTAPASPPDEPGPYGVGHETFEVVDAERDGRTLAVDVWYPADTPVPPTAPATYELAGEIGFPATLATDGAPPVDLDAPLIVFSHGNSGVRTQSVFLTETLASHGFVVAAPDHTGNTAADMITGTGVSQAQSAFDRPADMSLVIDRMLERNADPDDVLAGTIDPERIGMTGHSFGGLTSFLVAADSGAGQFEPRVGAIAPLAAVSSPLSDEALATITVPTLLVSGTEDTTAEIDPETTRPWEHLSSDVVYRVDIEGAGHMAFSHICDITDAFVEAGQEELSVFLDDFSDGACEPEALPVADVHRLTARYVVAFFLTELAVDPAAAAFLSPTEGVSFQER